MTAIYSLSMPAMMRKVTLSVRIKGVKVTRARMWLGMWLIRFAAWVIGCGIDIDTEGKPVTYDEKGVPSRSSVDDARFNAAFAARLDIYLDGVKQDRVISYDKDRGEVVVWNGDVHATKRGTVTVNLRDAAL